MFVGGTFNMSGGVITSNTARQNGGGVHMTSTGSFTKTGDSTITGFNEISEPNGNAVRNADETLRNNRGHTVYVDITPVRRRESTAGFGEDMTLNGATVEGFD